MKSAYCCGVLRSLFIEQRYKWTGIVNNNNYWQNIQGLTRHINIKNTPSIIESKIDFLLYSWHWQYNIEFFQFVWQCVVFHHHSVLIQWVIELLHRHGLINNWVIIGNWDVLKTSNRPMPGAEMWEQIILRFVARSSFHKNQDRCLPPSRNLLTSTNSLA